MIYGDIEIYNVIELLEDESGVKTIPTRLPNDLRLKLNDFAINYSLQTTGCNRVQWLFQGGSRTRQLKGLRQCAVLPPALRFCPAA